ncbi:mandelate racemase/muconate lactonizing enzyme family protein [Candidatus Pelagibacter sp.]|nr:mandelate racemase/muconate lactonizing enzyme family protein [Candidatus Pelagibacter sp.]
MSSISKIETWVTEPEQSDDGWATIKPFLFLKLTTSDGLEGWGEAFTLPSREKGIVEIIHNLMETISSSKDISPDIFNSKAKKIADGHRGIDFSAATSAIEMSLWDIEAKRKNKPLSHILSKDPKQKVSVYANTWSEKSPGCEILSKRATELLDKGYGGIKIYPLQNRTIEQAISCISILRENIGFEIPLMLDLASPEDPNIALKLASLVKEFKPYWFEEPIDGQSTRLLASIRKQTGFKIVTGEKQFGLQHFIETLAANAADILNPDIAGVGGIIDMIKISELSQKNNVTISPHCWNSMSIAASAMLHFCASNSNVEMAEIYPEYISNGLKYSDINFVIKDGFAELKDRPGLGVEIDIKSLMKLTSYHKQTKLR